VILVERDMVFDFTGCARAYKLDEQGRGRAPQGLKLVDFVVREPNRTLLVELKDPSDSRSTPRDRKFYARRLRTGELVIEELVPKCRDTYTYLHLMGEDDRPFLFVALLGRDRLGGVHPGDLVALQDRLRQGLKCEAAEPWQREYVHGCVVLATADWERHFPYKLERRPVGRS